MKLDFIANFPIVFQLILTNTLAWYNAQTRGASYICFPRNTYQHNIFSQILFIVFKIERKKESAWLMLLNYSWKRLK